MSLSNADLGADWSVQQSEDIFVLPDRQVIQGVSIKAPPYWLPWCWMDDNHALVEVVDIWDGQHGQGGDPNRVISPPKAIKVFKTDARWEGGLMQQVDVEKYATYRFTIMAHAWSNHNDEGAIPGYEQYVGDPRASWGVGDSGHFILEGSAPEWDPASGEPKAWVDAVRNFTFYVGIDPTGGCDPSADTVVWGQGAHIYNSYYEVPAVEVKAQADQITVFTKAREEWGFRNGDAYWEDAVLERVSEPAPPQPEPDPQRGKPRIDYKSVVNVVPPETPPQKAAEIFLDGWIRSREMTGGSYDQAAIGDLSDRTARLHLIPPEEMYDFVEFYRQNYSGVKVEFVNAEGNEILWLDEPTTHVPHVVTSPYNEQRDGYVHKGLDLRSSYSSWGDELLASIDGEVILTGVEEDREYFGYQVQIETFVNGDRVVVRYAHLVPGMDGGIYVAVGDEVRRGQPIGKPDNTGQSSGDHLHLDVRVNGGYVDPTPLILWAPVEEEPEGPEVTGPEPPETEGPTLGFHVLGPESGL